MNISLLIMRVGFMGIWNNGRKQCAILRWMYFWNKSVVVKWCTLAASIRLSCVVPHSLFVNVLITNSTNASLKFSSAPFLSGSIAHSISQGNDVFSNEWYSYFSNNSAWQCATTPFQVIAPYGNKYRCKVHRSLLGMIGFFNALKGVTELGKQRRPQ